MLTRHAAAGILIAALACGTAAHAVGTGRIEGSVHTPGGTGVGGVTVLLLREAGEVASTVTGPDGTFVFDRVASGSYGLRFTLAGWDARAAAVDVQPGETRHVEQAVDWESSLFESITVTSAARRRERIVDAPAAVTAVGEEEIALAGAPGQLPKLLEFTPGAQITQSGLYDFNLNTRGFNQALTRRVQTLLDGRDLSIPALSSQEWSLATNLADDLASVEFLRGPSAALYGPNSFNGVLNLVTKAPRDSQGGLLRLTAGELDTAKADARWAGGLGHGWYAKLLAGYSQSGDFTRSRNVAVEYPGLGAEAVPVPRERNRTASGSLRFDKYFADGDLLTFEAGETANEATTFVTPAGRSWIAETQRSWIRTNLNTLHWNLLATADRRDAPRGLNLATGGRFDLFSEGSRVELQGSLPTARGRLVGGVSYAHEDIDSADGLGAQTILESAQHAEHEAVFGQLDSDLGARLKVVLALRWDDSTLHPPQISPKGSLVYALSPNHTLRLSYNEAFQRANYGELFIRIPAGVLDLSGLEELFRPQLGGVSLGLGSVPLLILGNPDLDVETIRSLELGYAGILGSTAFLRVDYYRNRMESFITDVLPGVNPRFGPYRAPSGLPPALRALIEGTLNQAVPGLTNGLGGAPELVLSLGNAGEVDSQGVELALSWAPASDWLLDFSYAWFDFEVTAAPPGAVLSANAPENSLSAGVAYRRDRFAGALRYRWNDRFTWRSGVHSGPVPAYGVMSLDAGLDLAKNLRVGIDVGNLLNDRHYELFGGDLLGRRALGYVLFRW